MTTETLNGNQSVNGNLWWEYYGLISDPFTDYTQHEMSYSPAEWSEHIDLMQILVRHSYELLVIYGDIGCGKTTLMEMFIEQLDDSLPICRLNGNETLTIEELIQTTHHCFGLAVGDELTAATSVRTQINVLLNAIIQSGERFLLIIDDAHHLNSQLMQAILYSQAQRWEQQAPLSIILAMETSQEERFKMLSQAYVDKNMIKTIRLLPFELIETTEYIKHRLHQAGLRGELPINKEEIQHIHQWSGGLPGRINNVAKKVLTDAFLDDHYEENGSFWQSHQSKIVGSIVLLVILFAGFYIWNTQRNFNLNSHQQLAIPEQQNNKNAQVAVAQNANKSEKLGDMTSQDFNSSTNINAAQGEVATQPQVTPTSATSTLASANDQKTLQDTNNTQTLVPANHPTQLTEAKLDQSSSELDRYASSGQLAEENAPVQAKPQQTLKVVKLKPVQTETNIHEVIVKRKPITKIVKVAKREQPKLIESHKFAHEQLHHHIAKQLTRFNRDERYLLKVPKTEYTLQLIGVSHKKEINQFIKRMQLGHQAKYFKTKHQNKDWYVIVYGRYKSVDAARIARNKLPKQLRQQQPWVRSFASVHKAIEK